MFFVLKDRDKKSQKIKLLKEVLSLDMNRQKRNESVIAK